MQINRFNRDTNTHRYLPVSVLKTNGTGLSLYDYVVGALRDNNCCLIYQGDEVGDVYLPQSVFLDDANRGLNKRNGKKAYIDLYQLVSSVLEAECGCSEPLPVSIEDVNYAKRYYVAPSIVRNEATSLRKGMNSTSPHQILSSFKFQRTAIPNNPINLQTLITDIGDRINCCNPTVTTTFTKVCVTTTFDKTCSGDSDLDTTFSKVCVTTTFTKTC